MKTIAVCLNALQHGTFRESELDAAVAQS